MCLVHFVKLLFKRIYSTIKPHYVLNLTRHTDQCDMFYVAFSFLHHTSYTVGIRFTWSILFAASHTCSTSTHSERRYSSLKITFFFTVHDGQKC